MDKLDAMSVFNGVLLGDGSLNQIRSKYTCFSEGLADSEIQELLGYLKVVKDALVSLGIEISNEFPKTYDSVSRGKPYTRCILSSHSSDFLTEQHRRWYLNKRKMVPLDLELNPITLAHWFMGDGNSARDKRDGHDTSVQASLATLGFEEESVTLLEAGLHHLRINTGRKYDNRVKSGAGIQINILQLSINDFMHMIDPYIIEPYRYKVKYRA